MGDGGAGLVRGCLVLGFASVVWVLVLVMVGVCFSVRCCMRGLDCVGLSKLDDNIGKALFPVLG